MIKELRQCFTVQSLSCAWKDLAISNATYQYRSLLCMLAFVGQSVTGGSYGTHECTAHPTALLSDSAFLLSCAHLVAHPFVNFLSTMPVALPIFIVHACFCQSDSQFVSSMLSGADRHVGGTWRRMQAPRITALTSYSASLLDCRQLAASPFVNLVSSMLASADGHA